MTNTKIPSFTYIWTLLRAHEVLQEFKVLKEREENEAP